MEEKKKFRVWFEVTAEQTKNVREWLFYILNLDEEPFGINFLDYGADLIIEDE